MHVSGKLIELTSRLPELPRHQNSPVVLQQLCMLADQLAPKSQQADINLSFLFFFVKYLMTNNF